MNLQTVEIQITEAKTAMALERKRYEETMNGFQKQLEQAEREKALLLVDLDLERIKRAEQILELRVHDKYFDRSVVVDAIKDIIKETPQMNERYFGSKNYSGWINQRSDHTYFYGPTHGTIVCSVGLKKDYRKGLSDEQKENCLYYLNLLLDPTKREQLMGVKTA